MKNKIDFKKGEIAGYKKLIAEANERKEEALKHNNREDAFVEERRIGYFEDQIFNLERDIRRLEFGLPVYDN